MAATAFIVLVSAIGFGAGESAPDPRSATVGTTRGAVSWSEGVAAAKAECAAPTAPESVTISTGLVFSIDVPCEKLR